MILDHDGTTLDGYNSSVMVQASWEGQFVEHLLIEHVEETGWSCMPFSALILVALLCLRIEGWIGSWLSGLILFFKVFMSLIVCYCLLYRWCKSPCRYLETLNEIPLAISHKCLLCDPLTLWCLDRCAFHIFVKLVKKKKICRLVYIRVQ